MNSKLVKNDEFGLFSTNEDDLKIPYIAIEITQEQFDSIPRNFKPVWYEIDGKVLFDIKGRTPETTKKMAFLVLMDS